MDLTATSCYWFRVSCSAAGCLGTAVIFPIEVVKTQMQATRGTIGLLGTIRGTYATGLRGFYRGLLPALFGGPEKAVKLAMNDIARAALAPVAASITPGQQVLAGAFAGLAQATISTPNEMVKIRMVLMEKEVARGMPRLNAIQVVRDLGLRGMFKGFSATLARDLPYNVVFFPMYATVKGVLCTEGEEETMSQLVASGATAGMVAAWLGTPMDMVKTRLQQRGSPFTGIGDCMRTVYRTEGFRAFFKGSVNRMAMQAPMYAIVMAAFDLQKRFLAKNQDA